MKAPTMGMDVFGKAPKSETGKYFRNNVWWWRPLADLCLSLAPDICAPCEHWHSNDGDGLDAIGAEALAMVLTRNIEDGTMARMIAARAERLGSLPDEPCTICGGTGIRRDALGTAEKMPKRVIDDPTHPRHGQAGWCNGCDGRGSVRPFETHYPCSVENVAEFAEFLKDCGGFEIL